MVICYGIPGKLTPGNADHTVMFSRGFLELLSSLGQLLSEDLWCWSEQGFKGRKELTAVGGEDRERAKYGLSTEQSKHKHFMFKVFLRSYHRNSLLYDKETDLGVADRGASE